MQRGPARRLAAMQPYASTTNMLACPQPWVLLPSDTSLLCCRCASPTPVSRTASSIAYTISTKRTGSSLLSHSVASLLFRVSRASLAAVFLGRVAHPIPSHPTRHSFVRTDHYSSPPPSSFLLHLRSARAYNATSGQSPQFVISH